ncbi:MAG: septation regulator SpoVG [Firmicutes bacterium]|nr:septation regulator SpoVG [Bacillota bacterium]
MQITEVRIWPSRNGESKIKASASIVIDGAFIVHELRIVEGANGLFVAMPSRKTADGSFRDIAHPITPEAREEIQNLVLEEYKKRLSSASAS